MRGMTETRDVGPMIATDTSFEVLSLSPERYQIRSSVAGFNRTLESCETIRTGSNNFDGVILDPIKMKRTF